MSTRLRSLGFVLTALTASAALALPGCGGNEQASVRSRGSAQVTADGPPDGVPDLGERRAVGNTKGEEVGWYLQSELDARNRRVDERLIFGKLLGGRTSRTPYETKAKMIDALQVLDPIAVRNDAGETVAYIGDQLIALDDYAAAKATAEQTVEELRIDH